VSKEREPVSGARYHGQFADFHPTFSLADVFRLCAIIFLPQSSHGSRNSLVLVLPSKLSLGFSLNGPS
jgi:hypothetical protein